MRAGQRVAGALLGAVVAYLLMVATMAVVAYALTPAAALEIASYAFPIMLVALALGWWRADVLTQPFAALARRWRR